MYDRILIPTDGSDVATVAVAHAVDLADQYGAELHALYVADVDAISISLGTEQVDRIRQGKFAEMDSVRAKAEAATGHVASEAASTGISVVEHHAGGVPHRVITNYVKNNDIELVVMGSKGRSGVKRALLGSVTERTLRSVTVPVLVVDYADD